MADESANDFQDGLHSVNEGIAAEDESQNIGTTTPQGEANNGTDAALITQEELDRLTEEANGGDIEAQRRAGEALLLKSSQDGAGSESDDVITGFRFLCRASRHGDEEATEILRQQMMKGTEIPDDLVEEVQWCLGASRFEKSARKAAKDLFRAINPLSPDQTLLDKLTKREQKLLRKAMASGDEAQFIEQVMKRLHGRGGISLESLLQSNVEMEDFNKATLFQKVRRYPGKCIAVVLERTVDSAGSQGVDWLKRLVPTNQIYMVLAFFFYSLITLDLILWFVPLAMFLASFLTMAVSTMQMFYTRRKRKDVSAMASILSRFNDAVENETAESAYDWDKLTPYVTFFASLAFAVASFSLSDQTWVPCSELFWFSAVFCVACYYALSDHYDHLVILAVGFDVVAHLPHVIESMPNVPLVKAALNMVAGNWFSLTVFPGLYMNFGIPSISYLVVPILFVKMAIGKSWEGWYRILIPHLVCFSWWKMAALFFGSAPWFGLLRASAGWITFTLLFPLAVLAFVFGSIYYCLKLMTFSNFLKVIVTFVFMALPIGIGFWAKGGIKLENFSMAKNPYVRKILLLFLFILAFSAMFLRTPIESDVEGQFITWPQYRRYCSQPQWEKTNMADAQMQCSHLKHSIVEWEGIVKKVVIKETHNQAEDFLSYLPIGVSDWIKCAYGENYPECKSLSNEKERELCELATLQGHHSCHIKNLDIYKFEIWIQMPLDESGENFHDVRVEASNWFKSEIMKISTGDLVHFRASLMNNLGNTWPELRLYYLKCDGKGVDYGSKTTLSETSWRIVEQVRRGFYTTWNFFAAPVFEFKEPDEL